MKFELYLTTDDPAEAAIWMARFAKSQFSDNLIDVMAEEALKGARETPTLKPEAPTVGVASAPKDAPIAEDVKPAKRGPGRPRKAETLTPVADSKDPAQIDLTKPASAPAPSPESQGGVSTGALPIPSLDEVKVLMDRYRDKFGLAALKTKLVEAGVNRFTELGDALPAFYAARMAEVAA